MSDDKPSETPREKKYTYQEYLKHFHRTSKRSQTRTEEKEPSEVGREMAKEIIGRLLSHD